MIAIHKNSPCAHSFLFIRSYLKVNCFQFAKIKYNLHFFQKLCTNSKKRVIILSIQNYNMFHYIPILNEKYKILFSQKRLSEQGNRQKNKAFCIKLQSAFFISFFSYNPLHKSAARYWKLLLFRTLSLRLNKVVNCSLPTSLSSVSEAKKLLRQATFGEKTVL